jgi:hypothetical protein
MTYGISVGVEIYLVVLNNSRSVVGLMVLVLVLRCVWWC